MSTWTADKLSFQVLINGISVSGLLSASIVTTNCFSADTFSLSISMGSQSENNLAFWASIYSAYVEISVTSSGFPTFVSLMTGMIDTVHIDPIQKIVALEGRDLSATMIDAYRQQDFVNQTASEVVAAIANYHGLTPAVTPTTEIVGRYFSSGYTKLSLGQFSRVRSDWDFLVQLARENRFDVFVEGKTLYFQPSAIFDGLPIVLSLTDAKRVRIERNLTVSQAIAADVQSWNSQGMASYRSNVSGNSVAVTQSPPVSGSSSFLFSASNFTSEQVQASANQYAEELGRLATIAHLDMPWDLTITPRASILLIGTATALDLSSFFDFT